MIPAQRRRDILKHLGALGASRIADLSGKYGVSEMTIRRDLKTLEDEGLVQMTHGGVLFSAQFEPQGEPLYAAKEQSNNAEKERIARYAVQEFVSDDAIIALEAGTTVGAMVPFLRGKRGLTVITNGLRTTHLLESLLPNVTVICTGGILREVSSTFVGPTAERFFREFNVQKLFLSGIGFTIETGVTDPQMIDTQVKRAMIAAAEQSIVLMDASKFGVRSFTPVISLQEMTCMVTDARLPSSFQQKLTDMNVDLRIVSE